MSDEETSRKILSRLVSICTSLPENKQDEPFRVLLSFKNPSVILNIILDHLENTRESLSKSRTAAFFCSFFQKVQEKSIKDPLSYIIRLSLNTPTTFSLGKASEFAKCIKSCLIKLTLSESDLQSVYSQLLESKDSIAPLTIAIIGNCPSLIEQTMTYLLDNLDKGREIDFISLAELINNIGEVIPKVLKSDVTINKLMNSLITTLPYTKSHKKSLFILTKALFKNLELNQSKLLAKELMPTLLPQLRDQSIGVRSTLLDALAEVKNEDLLSSMLPPIASSFVSLNDKYGTSFLQYLLCIENNPHIQDIVKGLLISNETMTAAVVISCYLYLFDNQQALIEYCFPIKLTRPNALASLTGIQSFHNKVSETVIKPILNTLTLIFDTNWLMDDLEINNSALESIDALSVFLEKYHFQFITAFFSVLPKIRDNDVIGRFGILFSSFIETHSFAPPPCPKYASLLPSLLIKLFEFAEDSEFVNQILSIISIIAAFCNGKTIERLKKGSLHSICKASIPPDYVDNIRTEVLYQMQQKPTFSIVAAAIPLCGPFLQSLLRVVKTQNSSFVSAFLKEAAECDLDSLIPHLERFAEPFVLKKSVFDSIKKAKQTTFAREVYDCICFICTNMQLNQSQYQGLLTTLEVMVERNQSIESFYPESLEAFVSFSSLDFTSIWSFNTLLNLCSIPKFSSVFASLLKHAPSDLSLVSVATKSFATELITADLPIDNFVSSLNCLFPEGAFLHNFVNGIVEVIRTIPLPIRHLKLLLTGLQTVKNPINDSAELFVQLSIQLFSGNVDVRSIAETIIGLLYPRDKQETRISIPLLHSEVVSCVKIILREIIPQLSEELFRSVALFLVRCRPFLYQHGILFENIVDFHQDLLLRDSNGFMKEFFEIDFVDEAKVSYINAFNTLSSKSPDLFINNLFQHKMNPSLEEALGALLRHDEFITGYSQLVYNSQLPHSSKDQLSFLTSGLFETVPIFIEYNYERFGVISVVLLVWLAHLFAVQLGKSASFIQNQITENFTSLFVKLGYSPVKPIEFNLSGPKPLYESIGTLVNSLIFLDFRYLVDFCTHSFNLLKSNQQQVVFIAGLTLSRLFFRIQDCNTPSSHRLIQQLRIAVAFSFTASSDENCRTLASLLSTQISSSLFCDMPDNSILEIITGTLRGLHFSSEDSAHDAFVFLCQCVKYAPSQILDEYSQDIFNLINANQTLDRNVLDVLTVMSTNEQAFAYLSKFLPQLVFRSIIKRDDACKKILVGVTGLTELQDIPSSLQKILSKDFDEFCLQLIDKINKTEVNEEMLTLLISIKRLSPKNEEFVERVVSLLMSIMDDAQHKNRHFVANLLPAFF